MYIYIYRISCLRVIKKENNIPQTNCLSLGLHWVYTAMWFWLLKALQRKRTSLHRLWETSSIPYSYNSACE